MVAVLAALLAAAAFLSDEAIKHVITGETGAVDDSARLEANDVKITLAAADSRPAAGGGARQSA